MTELASSSGISWSGGVNTKLIQVGNVVDTLLVKLVLKCLIRGQEVIIAFLEVAIDVSRAL